MNRSSRSIAFEAESIEGISQNEQEILDAEAVLANETKLHNIEHAWNKAGFKLMEKKQLAPAVSNLVQKVECSSCRPPTVSGNHT